MPQDDGNRCKPNGMTVECVLFIMRVGCTAECFTRPHGIGSRVVFPHRMPINYSLLIN